MIRSFRNAATKAIFAGQQIGGLPPDIQERVRAKLVVLDTVATLQELRSPPGNRLEALKGDRKGQYSIRVNERWRLCFRWTADGVEEVEFVDYHR